jgi:type I restriction enzyme S subunit
LRDDLGEIDQDIDAIRQSIVGEADGEVEVLSNVCNVVKGKTGIKKAVPGRYPLVTTAEERASHNEYQIDGDAVCIPLVSSTGHGHASIKRIHFQSGKFALGTILAAVLPKDPEKLSAKYLYYYLSTFKDEAIVSLMKGMANVTLTAAKIGNIPIFVPEYQKQVELVELMERCQELRDTLKRSNSDAEDMIKATFLNAFPERARFEGDV